ncbi:MAG: glycoside hydrolase family 16 protein, partial [Bacteroidota bacterium]|nr:glycoside hydrolase family 16 protein [Bacteroidota bacterium]
MKKVIIALMSGGMLFSCQKDVIISANTSIEKDGWELTFHDEFNEPELDWGKWMPFYSWAGRERENMLYVDSALTFQNGNIIIKADNEPADGKAYTSGMISSHLSMSQQYGYFEVRCKIPKGYGLWPAFWMMPTVGYPPELDI